MLVVTFAVALAPAVPVGAHGFGTTASPDFYIADNGLHTYAVYDGSASDRALMEATFNGRMTGQYDARTQLDVLSMTYSTNTDAYWYVTDTIPGPGVAYAECMEYWETQHEGADRCNRTRIRFERPWAQTASTNQKRQGACHEIGHSLGFDDSQPETNTGCMSGGPVGYSSTHEVGHINSTYDPY